MSDNKDWFKKLFINEAKPAMKRHSGGGGGDTKDTLNEFIRLRGCEYLCGYCSTLTSIPKIDTSNVISMNHMFYGCSALTSIPEMDTSNVTNMNYMFDGCKSLTSIPEMDTSNVTTMTNMFNGCKSLTSIPEMDTSNVTSMYYMFNGCSALTSIPEMDTSNVTTMSNMFNGCSALTSIPEMDTSNVTVMLALFSNCSALTTIPEMDLNSATSTMLMFIGCQSLTDVRLKNIKVALTVGSGTSYGHLLTVDSLLYIIGELVNTGSTNRLTIGTANMSKLTNVYVRVTDSNDPKLPFEVCESTDEDAVLITQYVNAKNWELA